jgi:hypothetical protein
MKRREFIQSVRSEIVRRATRNGRVHCEICGIDVTSKKWEIDHIIPEGMLLDKMRKLTCDDGQLLGLCCHRGPDGKTAKDVKAIAKAKRQEAGQFKRPAGNIKSAGFMAVEKPMRAMDKANALPRRSMFRAS